MWPSLKTYPSKNDEGVLWGRALLTGYDLLFGPTMAHIKGVLNYDLEPTPDSPPIVSAKGPIFSSSFV